MSSTKNYSLNEVHALTKRAARGAGFSWSVAAQCAFATRRLHLHGLNGAQAAAGYLQFISSGQACFAPTVSSEVWGCEHGSLCPILTGSALSDFDSVFSERLVVELTLSQLANPLLLVPFAALLCNSRRQAVRVSWSEISVICREKQWEVHGELSQLNRGNAVSIKIELDNKLRATIPSDTGVALNCESFNYRLQRANVDTASFKTLEKLAYKTYAPNTEVSRLSGAGAGISDND